MKLKWLGHSCFELTLDGGVLVTDPYDESVGYPPLRVRADAVLSSHDHFDHNYFAAVEGDPAIINTPGAHAACGATITATPSFHDTERGAKRGSNLIFTIEAEGLRIAHLGDLGHLLSEEQLAALGRIDLLLIPVGGYYTIDAATARRQAAAVGARLVLPMHYRGPGFGYDVIGPVEPFLALAGNVKAVGGMSYTPDLADAPATIVFSR